MSGVSSNAIMLLGSAMPSKQVIVSNQQENVTVILYQTVSPVVVLLAYKVNRPLTGLLAV